MRFLSLGLLALLLILQYRLWLAEGGIAEATRLNERVQQAKEKNKQLAKLNNLLNREVTALRIGNDIIEEHAREKHGLVKKNEIYYQFVDESAPK